MGPVFPINILCAAWDNMHRAVKDVHRFRGDPAYELSQWGCRTLMSRKDMIEDDVGKAQSSSHDRVNWPWAEAPDIGRVLSQVVQLESGVEE